MLGDLDLFLPEKTFRASCDNAVESLVTPALLQALDRNEVAYPDDFIRQMGERGLLGRNVPKENGGPGGTFLEDAMVSELTGYHGTATMACARTFTAHIGYVLSRYGSKTIQERFLQPMLAGTMIACQGMTEPGAGSDLSRIESRLVPDGLGWRLRGQKRFVDGAQTAGFMLAAARLGESTDPRRDFVAVVIDTRDPGFIIREVQNDWHGFRGMGSAWVEFRDVHVDPENVVGVPGQAWTLFMEELIVERVVMARAQLGQAERALRIATNYAQHRNTFDRPLFDHEAVSFRLAHAAAQLDAAYLLDNRAARLLDQHSGDTIGRNHELEAAIAKYVGTEAAWQAADDAIQVIGGMGYTTKYPVERIQRDTRAARITGGSSEMMQLIIARHLKKEWVDATFREDLVGHEVDGSPVFNGWNPAPEGFHPTDKQRLWTIQAVESPRGSGND
jgi:hypothetical protein